jgi:PEP-CTERM motif-containing protein
MKMRLIAVFAATVLFAAAPAFADPIVITGGSVSIGSLPFGPFPPFGVNLLGDGTDIGAVTFNEANGFVKVGQPISLSSTINISTIAFGPFDQVVQGVNFRDVLLQGTLNFAATPFIVSRGAANTTPFTMTGELSIFQLVPFQGPGALLLTAALTGSGTAGIGLAEDLGGGDFSTSGIGFSFSPAAVSPTPEPGTFVLVAGGLAAAVRRFKRIQ